MGLFGSAQQRFAKRAARAVAEAGGEMALHFDREEFALVATDGQARMFLGNAYEECERAPRDERAGILARHASSFVQSCQAEALTWDEVRPRLRLAIRARSSDGLMRLRHQLDSTAAYEPVGDHLAAFLMIDDEDSFRWCAGDDLEGWCVSEEEALAVGHEQTRRSLEQAAKIGSVYRPVGDEYTTSLILYPEALAPLEVMGDPVVMVPTRETLLVVGADDEEGLVQLAQMASASLEDERPVFSVPLRLVDGRWEEWFPPPGHPAREALRTLFVQSVGSDYAEQAPHLEPLHEEDFIATFSAIVRAGEPLSYAVWTAGLDTLLPRTDLVLLVDPETESDGELRDVVWERFAEVLGDRLEPLDLDRPRFRVRGAPTAEDLAAMGVE